MRKIILAALVATVLALCCASALAEAYVFDDIYATIDIPEGYFVLTPGNLSEYADWLQARGSTTEDTTNDFLRRGVLLQAWTTEYDVCFELRAQQTARAQAVFDVNDQSESVRGTYRTSHYPDNAYALEGYDFSASTWKKTEEGRFLVLRYVMRDGGEITHRGFMRRTIRNGYEITLDLQVHGRAAANRDNTALNDLWSTFRFIEILPLPPKASAKLVLTELPPQETNKDTFTIEGTAAEGVRITTVVMGLNQPNPVSTTTEVGKNGKIKIPIILQREGAFGVSLTCEYQGETVLEDYYPVAYSHTLLAVNVIHDLPEVTGVDEVTISGTSVPGATIQILVNDEDVIRKRVNTAGKFKVDLDFPAEGVYNVTLVFSKAGLADSRISRQVTRQWSQAEMLKQLKAQAIKPGYATLVKKIEGYVGRVMGYNSYVVDVASSGDEWIVTMALTKKGDEYRSVFLVTSASEPGVAPGEKVTMYGTCAGMTVPEEDGGESFPVFELLLFVQ